MLIDLTFVAPSDCSSTREDGEDFDALKTELLPHFNWMKGLKSLAILAKDDGHDRNFKFTREFVLDWLSELEFQSLERLWVFPLVFNDELEHALICEMTSPVVKSGMMNLCTDDHISELNAEQFHQLEHLADIKFDEVKHDGLEHLPHLKYISGKCGMGAKVY